jgi:hypothetical protein
VHKIAQQKNDYGSMIAIISSVGDSEKIQVHLTANPKAVRIS